jgi:DNA-binding transcriptional LysR family regulator
MNRTTIVADLNHVALFARVVEPGSFSGAARALAMPKATISRKIAQLEADLGARLLQRTTRRITLTELGRAYYADAAQGLASIEKARERIAASQAEPTGTLRLAAPVGFGAQKLMGWIAEFLHSHEKVRIELKLTDDAVDLIGNGIDLAFRPGKLPDSSMITRRLGTSRLALVASPDYLCAGAAAPPASMISRPMIASPSALRSTTRCGALRGRATGVRYGCTRASLSMAPMPTSRPHLPVSALPSCRWR